MAARSRVEEVLTTSGAVRGVRTTQGEIAADVVINCAGAWAGEIRVPGAEVKVRPIKGQMLALEVPEAAPASGRPRLTLYSHHAYVVPRSDGRIIVGTTVEDRGFDKTVEAGAVARLVAGATKLCPALSSARFLEAWAGLRPLGEDELPRIGPAGPRGYFLAVGHYRNGILLTPLTAKLLADSVAGRRGLERAGGWRPAAGA